MNVFGRIGKFINEYIVIIASITALGCFGGIISLLVVKNDTYEDVKLIHRATVDEAQYSDAFMIKEIKRFLDKPHASEHDSYLVLLALYAERLAATGQLIECLSALERIVESINSENKIAIVFLLKKVLLKIQGIEDFGSLEQNSDFVQLMQQKDLSIPLAIVCCFAKDFNKAKQILKGILANEEVTLTKEKKIVVHFILRNLELMG